MLKLKVLYSDEGERKKLLSNIASGFNIIKVSKEYKSDEVYKRIYVNIENKLSIDYVQKG